MGMSATCKVLNDFQETKTRIFMMSNYKFLAVCVTLLLGLLPISATAHHSFAATFDLEAVNEIEGEVVSVGWRNPHIVFDVQVTGTGGSTEIYEVESHSVSIMRRMDMDAETFLQVGDVVRIAGNPARRNPISMFALNVLLPSGREVVLDPWGAPRWAESVGSSNTWITNDDEVETNQRGLFRVWSTSLVDPMSSLPFHEVMDPAYVHTYPLTPNARRVLEAYDVIGGELTADCAIKGMPSIMEQPYPMEIVEVGGNILLRIEEHDTVRTIYMSENPAARMPSTLGYSLGRMEGNTLIVETSEMNWGHFNTMGIPLSSDVTVLERFILTDDNKRLDYEMTVVDPVTFTEPVELSKYWLAIPGASVQPYECVI